MSRVAISQSTSKTLGTTSPTSVEDHVAAAEGGEERSHRVDSQRDPKEKPEEPCRPLNKEQSRKDSKSPKVEPQDQPSCARMGSSGQRPSMLKAVVRCSSAQLSDSNVNWCLPLGL